MKLTTCIAAFCGLYCLCEKPGVLIGAVFFYCIVKIIAIVLVSEELERREREAHGSHSDNA